MPHDPGSELRTIASRYARCARCHGFGVPSDPRRIRNASLARAMMPRHVRVLFIAESPPQTNKRGRQAYFYLPEDDPAKQDRSALFWALAEVLGLAEARGITFRQASRSPAKWKAALLTEFSARGLWLLDSAKCAVNGLPEGARRNGALGLCAAAWLRREMEVVSPDHIVLIKANIFREVGALLESWNLGGRVLNDRLIPYPGSGHQVEFRKAFEALVRAHPELFARPSGAVRLGGPRLARRRPSLLR